MIASYWTCVFCNCFNLPVNDFCENCGKGKDEDVARLPDSKMVIGVK